MKFENQQAFEEVVSAEGLNLFLGAGLTGVLGGASSASMAFIETMVGYGLGYTAGYLIK